MDTMRWLASARREFLYASRALRSAPGLSASAILTLALGIGANTAIFSILEGVVFSPLPYPQPDRLVVVALYNRALGYPTYLSYPDFLDWRHDSRSFDQIAAYAGDGFDLSSPGAAEHLDGKEVSSNFFLTLGVPLAIGRGFSPEEDRIGGAPAAVISDRLWQDRFARSPSALGKTLTLNGIDYTIVGVLNSRFRFGDRYADVYTPLARRNSLYLHDRTVHDILCVARLRPEVSVSRALAEMNTVQAHIDELNPNTERGQDTSVLPLKQLLVGDVAGTLELLFGAVGLVLLIACTNVANLLLAHSAARAREFAIRLALGARRSHIVRQCVAESLLLSMAGGILGLAIAEWGVRAILAAVPGSLPRIENIGVHTPVLMFAFALSIAVGVVFGLLPALSRPVTGLLPGLAEGGRSVAGGQRRTQRVLVILQVALALVLLTGGSLLLRTIDNLWAVSPGFDPRHVVTFQVGLSPPVTSTPARLRAAYRQLVRHIREIPGVVAAGMTALVPLSGGANEGPFWVGSHQPASMAEIPRAIYYPVDPDYVTTMAIPLLRGRLLARSGNVNSEVVVLIDSLLAERYFPAQNPIGQIITIPHWGATLNMPARVVGVVGHVKHYSLDGSMAEKPQIYYSFYQLPDEAISVFRSEVALVVRTDTTAATLMPALRKAIHGAGGDQPVYNVRTMGELVTGSMGRQRLPMLLLVSFAVLALLLAVNGIYGVISYSTIRRVNEIGVRMALGARSGDVLRMIVAEGLRLAIIGVALGATTVLVLAKLFSSFSRLLYGVQSNDPVTLAAVSLVLIVAAALACMIPARRAALLEPFVALRRE